MMTKATLFSEKQQNMAAVFKALGHPARLAILQYLAEQSTCITGDISNHIPLSRSTVAQHLSELKEAGIIKGNTSGSRVNYCIDTVRFETLKKEMGEFMAELKTN